jgi:hypothetical protein
MSDKALLFVLIYLLVSFGAGVFVGKAIKWGQGEDHERPR